ncbi:MAG: phasin family protein [Motilibacteraceae bacterium]
MVLEGLRGYLQIASGLTDVTRQRATSVAQSLLAQGAGLGSGLGAGLSGGLPSVGDLREQVAGVAEDLLATSKANREMLLGLVRGEVERQVTKLGLVSASELEAATKRAQRLEVRVHDLERRMAGQPSSGAAPAPAASAPAGSVTKAPASTVPPRKVATKAPATKAPATKVATKAPAAPTKKVAKAPARGRSVAPDVAAAPTPGERAAAKRAVAGARKSTARKGTQA